MPLLRVQLVSPRPRVRSSRVRLVPAATSRITPALATTLNLTSRTLSAKNLGSAGSRASARKAIPTTTPGTRTTRASLLSSVGALSQTTVD